LSIGTDLVLSTPSMAVSWVRVHQVNRLTRHDRRDCMLVDELGMPIAPQQDTKIIKPRNNALQLHAIDQEDCEGSLVLTNVVEECILEALNFVCRHRFFPPLFLIAEPTV